MFNNKFLYENAYDMSQRHNKEKNKIINDLLKEINNNNMKMMNELKLIIDKYQNSKTYILQRYNSISEAETKKVSQKISDLDTRLDTFKSNLVARKNQKI